MDASTWTKLQLFLREKKERKWRVLKIQASSHRKISSIRERNTFFLKNPLVLKLPGIQTSLELDLFPLQLLLAGTGVAKHQAHMAEPEKSGFNCYLKVWKATSPWGDRDKPGTLGTVTQRQLNVSVCLKAEEVMWAIWHRHTWHSSQIGVKRPACDL